MVDNANGELEQAVINMYHALTGVKPDDKMEERIKAGVEAGVYLQSKNPDLFYGFAAIAATSLADLVPQIRDSQYAVSLTRTFAAYFTNKAGEYLNAARD